ncbi:thiamine diphosphokinase [Clostridium gasigenes]|uniref:thiamine diphosphokinase n=1 Tax=Clostridium gasigenes TaxID=94869 RepID=UPI001C0E7FC9|nr:thiamine diphosphokinase [Clostridium gasigenes]MBU3135641.1 thiamine diphosphokinase [Clostridium gasigenes]
MKALIVSGGRAPSEELLLEHIVDSELIIGADRGCEVLLKHGVVPSYIIGDFDSASKETIKKLEEMNVCKFKYKKEKDYTDTELAFKLALDKGATEIIMMGVTGSRYDHTLGNIGLLLKALELKVNAKIVDDNNKIYLINKNTKFTGHFGDIISFQAYFQTVKSLNIKGAKYELSNYDLKIGESITTSNEFLEESIEISFEEGVLMVLHTKD